MNWNRVAMVLVVVALSLGAIYLCSRMGSNDVDKRIRENTPFTVRIAVVNETDSNAVDLLARLSIYPEQNRLLLYFVNTDAYYEGIDFPIRRMNPESADRFNSLLGVSTDYHIHVKRAELARLIDLAEGIHYFNENPTVLEKSDFQYPQGIQFFSGEQATEFAFARLNEKRDTDGLASIDRLYRMESIALNVYWQLPTLAEKLKKYEVKSMAAGLVDTNMTVDELRSLFDFLSSGDRPHTVVLETPLTLEKYPVTKLIIKDKRVRGLFSEFSDNMKLGKYEGEDFTLEVLNGTDTPGMARRLKQFFQDKGVSVLSIDNYPYKPVAESVLLDRSGNSFYSQKLSDITSIPSEKVFFRRQAAEVENVFIIGEDFSARKLQN